MLSEYIMYTNCMYHHYKGNQLPRSDAIQKLVVERILANPLTDDQRENSKVWELKHSSSCIQIGRLLAIKRGLNVELAETICALHDIYAIDTGHYDEHAQKGAGIVEFKDADIFDCSLHEGTKKYYEKHKPIEVRREYYHRIQKVREELGLPPDIQFTVK